MNEFKEEQRVSIPTSELGRMYGNGVIVQVFGDTIMVDFDGRLGKYTIHKHDIKVIKDVE